MKTTFYILLTFFSMFTLSKVEAAIVIPSSSGKVQQSPGAHQNVQESPGATQHVQESPGAGQPVQVVARELARAAPGADPRVIEMALSAMRCAQANGQGVDARRLGVIDFSVSSSQPRLWVFDLAKKRLLFHTLVAHGAGSGGDLPTNFSNRNNSHASSIGLYLTHQTYYGHRGLSLRMAGLDKGFNDAAMKRAIVLHGAPYVNEKVVKALGRLGRSWGCPALPKKQTRPIINVMKNGQFLFAYYPDKRWITQSSIEQCAIARMGGEHRVENLASAR